MIHRRATDLLATTWLNHLETLADAAPRRTTSHRIGFGAMCLAAALVVRLLMTPALGDELPYTCFSLAAMLAAWYGRWRVGIAVLVCGTVLGYYLFVPPQQVLIKQPPSYHQLVHLVGAQLPTLLSIGLIELLHMSRRKANQTKEKALTIGDQLRLELSRRQKAESELQLLHEMTRAIGEADDVESAMGIALNKICAHTQWALGHAWLLGLDGSKLVFCRDICISNSAFAEFTKASQDLQVSNNLGVLTKVLETKKAVWSHSLDAQQPFLRAEAARKVGLKMGWFFPVLAGDQVVAILEFFHTESSSLDEEMARFISAAVGQLGTMIQQKQAEQRSRDNQRRLKEAQQIAKVGDWEWDVHSGLVTWSDELYELFGVTRSEFQGTFSAYLPLIHPADRKHVADLLESAMKNETTFEFEHRRIHPDNSVRSLHCRARIERDVSGAVIKMMGTAQDITERKKVELDLQYARQQLQDYAASLERKVAARTEELEKSLKQMEGFCYTIAHDLRAPVRAMGGLTSAILEDFGDNLAPMGKEYAERVVTASRQMDQLIRDLLDYGRLTHIRLPKAWIDLNVVIKQVVEEFIPETIVRKASIRIKSQFPHLFTNELVFRQVLSNLIENALKFLRESIPAIVEISAEDGADRVRISVKDNGIGIPERFQHKIFGVFEKLHPPSRFPGTGIGLAIVSKGVERLGGRVGVISETDKGSCFWFELPKHS